MVSSTILTARSRSSGGCRCPDPCFVVSCFDAAMGYILPKNAASIEPRAVHCEISPCHDGRLGLGNDQARVVQVVTWSSAAGRDEKVRRRRIRSRLSAQSMAHILKCAFGPKSLLTVDSYVDLVGRGKIDGEGNGVPFNGVLSNDRLCGRSIGICLPQTIIRPRIKAIVLIH